MPLRKEIHTLPLTAREIAYLEEVSSARSGSVLRARRAAMLLQYSNGVPIPEIARTFRCNARSVEHRINKAILQEVLVARRKDAKGRDLRAITPAMLDWVHWLSCQNPGHYGYSCAMWPASLLAQHVRDHCRDAGHHALAGLRCAELERLMKRHRARSTHTEPLAAANAGHG